MSSTQREWEIAHHAIVSLGLARAAHEHLLGRAMLRALRAESWLALGMGSFFEYAERFLGLGPRQTEERLRVASALEELPELDAALAEGRLHFSTVREVSRVADPQTERAWIDAVKGKSVAEVEAMVSGRKRGDGPEDEPQPEAQRHRIVLEVSAATYATYREAQAALRREADRLSEEDGLLLMARTVLGGPKDAGRSSYQIQMTVCSGCGRAEQAGRGRSVAIGAVSAEMASCDAQRIGSNGRAAQDIPPATRRLVMTRHQGRCAAPGCRHATFLDVHHVRLRSEGGNHDPDGLILLCSGHHRALHRGALLIDGTWSSGFRFMHADGSVYGSPASPHLAAMLADVQGALCGMGFKEREARAAIQAVRPHAGANMTLPEVLRLALRAGAAAAPV